MTSLCCDVLTLLAGKTLVTAESCTGGGIGAALTAISGSSAVYKGGVISYTNWVKHHILDVPQDALDTAGAVSALVAESMAMGARNKLQADVADMVLTDKPEENIAQVRAALDSGELSSQRLQEAVLRILLWKLELGVIQ